MIKRMVAKVRTEVVDYLIDIEKDEPFFVRAKTMAKAALVLALSFRYKD